MSRLPRSPGCPTRKDRHEHPHPRPVLDWPLSAGRIATSQLVDLIGITSDSAVLDAGSGIACAADIG
jgi:hypothetical protein